MSEGDNGALAALGALLGYVGAEAATVAPFECLLWPQRHLSKLSWRTAVASAILMPMGGPFHKAALEIFDVLHRHGLFRGAYRGHMLGTAFFKNIGWTYSMHDLGVKGEIKAMRNCLWVGTLNLISPPPFSDGSQGQIAAKRRHDQVGGAPERTVRARISCHHLTFSQATSDDKASALPFVCESVGTPGPRTFLLLLTAESTAVIVAIVLVSVWKTPWAALWLAPLILRILSAIFAVHRGPLITSPNLTLENHNCDFQVHCPESNGDFMVFTGPPPLIRQFMQHYGHPCRSRSREVLQLFIIAALGCIFPLGLVASALFMPPHLQYAWFGYQMFLVTGLHLARYSQFVRILSVEAEIAEAFERDERFVSLGKGSLLFGQTRNGSGTIKLDLEVKVYDKYAEGTKAVKELLMNPDQNIEGALEKPSSSSPPRSTDKGQYTTLRQ